MNDVRTITHSPAASALNEAESLVRRGGNAEKKDKHSKLMKIAKCLSSADKQVLIDFACALMRQQDQVIYPDYPHSNS